MNRKLHREEIAQGTFADHGATLLSRLGNATGLGDKTRNLVSAFTRLIAPWGERKVGKAPEWLSDIVDDHSPFELSVSVGGRRSEVRFLLEAQGDAPTLRAQQDAARELTRRLQAEFGADLRRFEKVEDLFMPEDPKGIFAMWHAVSFGSDQRLDVKAYLNLQARGRALAPALAEDALLRLGVKRAWPMLSRIAAARGFDADELIYFSLDLSARADARVKVYLRHHNATAADLEAAMSLCPSYEPGQVTEMCRALGGGDGPFSTRACVTCFSYVEGDLERPSEATFYFPITGYVTDDREATARISAYLTGLGVSPEEYQAAAEACAVRPLEDGVGMQSYVSMRKDHGKPRLTVYFSPEAYSTVPPRARPPVPVAAKAPPTPEEIVRRHEVEPLTNHPFFRRLRREPADLARLWKLMANFRVALIDGFPRMLSSVVARIEDDRIRCVLAKQLNDEMGNGDFSRAHKKIFGKLLSALDPWQPASLDDDALFAPGRALGAELDRLYTKCDPHEGVGATLLVEVYGKHVDQFLGDEFRRQGQIDQSSLEWLTMHEVLEMDHADDSVSLAKLLPEGEASALAVRGAEAVAEASRQYFDAMYALCFG